MSKKIWDLPRVRQIRYLNLTYLKVSTYMDKIRYRVTKKILQKDKAILDELEPKTKEQLIKKLFYFKFESSCSNAKYVRCGKKKGYEDVQFLLGDWNSLIRNLRRYRPDLVQTGIKICDKYVRNNFDDSFAPILHRKNDIGNYEWNNIEIMTRKEHDKLTKQERQKKKLVY